MATKAKDLKPAECFGEVVVSLKFRTGAVGETPAWQLVPMLFDKFLTSLQKSKDLALWEAEIEGVSYEPFKKTCGGKAFTMKVDQPIVRIDA
jgi:hypothetical protein